MARFFSRSFCTSKTPPFALPAMARSTPTVVVDISHPTYMIWGSNTGVGKTLVSAGLAFSVLSSIPSTFLYLKPVQTGFPEDSDSRFVYSKVSELFRNFGFRLSASSEVVNASASASGEGEGGMKEVRWLEEKSVDGGRKAEEGSELLCKSLYCWKEAISPHLAAERERALVGDEEVVDLVRRCLMTERYQQREDVWKVIETAGGVASPGPSGTLQCDLYRPFRIPAVLVGDGRLGGISGTISAYETLKLRGYDVVAVILEDHGLSNEVPLMSYLRNRVQVLVMPPTPQDPLDDLMQWFGDSVEVFNSLRDSILAAYLERTQRFHDMASKAGDILWWPFTQHGLVARDAVTVIDSRFGENFAVHKVCNNRELIVPQFDACASWWTQGPDATLQIELARDMGYAAARFGHVMFPENVYEPALHCADVLLQGVGKGWASRVFFSDNGSTAIEIALKMAFRKFSYDHGILPDANNGNLGKVAEFKVLALCGSYHGDTLGAMEAQAPSSYTGFLQQPWYSGRGLFLEPPTVFLCSTKWNLSIPDVLQFCNSQSSIPSFDMLEELFDDSRDMPSDLAQCYTAYISKQLSLFSESSENTYIGALIIEPVIHGSGGMHMIDPLFQRVLVQKCRSLKIPIIFDEVFTGFWRLGTESAAELLGCLPDIACYAKLMTGGIIPLAATLASEAVFEAYKGNSKIMALLHGHSYSAHAMGCTAAVKAISWFKDPHVNLNISSTGKRLKELWDAKLLLQISSHPAVQRVVALGTVCAVELKVEGSNAGYGSLFASSLVRMLREDGIYMRPLGNVVYLMCGPCTPSQVCNKQLSKVYQGIEKFSQHQSAK